MLRYSLLALLGLVTFAGLALSAVVAIVKAAPGSSAPGWWSSGVGTATIALLGVCAVCALVSRGRARAAWAGACLAGALYWGLIFTSWLSGDAGSRLVTSKLLVLADNKLGGTQPIPAPQPPMALYPTYNTFIAGSGIPGVDFYNGTIWPVIAMGPVGFDTSRPLQETGHNLLVWPLALVGGLLAGFVYARTRGSEKRAASAEIAAANFDGAPGTSAKS